MEKLESSRWKYFIPRNGIYATNKIDTTGKGKWRMISLMLALIFFNSATFSQATDLPKVGQTVKTNNFEITLTKLVDKTVVGGQFINQNASEGAIFVAVEFKYKNISGQPISSRKLPKKLKLIGPDGIKYESDMGASSKYATETKNNSKIMSDLNPGITTNNSKVFEISKDSWKQPGWSLLIDADDDVYYKLK